MEFDLEKAIEILAQTPLTIKSLLGDLSDQWTMEKDVPDIWSPFDIVGHLIHGEETDWIPRAKIILAQAENITFEPFDRFAQFEHSKGKSPAELLERFGELRGRNLEILKGWNLTQSRLGLKGIHPELGQVDLKQLLATWVVHDLTHIRQIVSVLAKKYTGNVGAWEKYLSILQS